MRTSCVLAALFVVVSLSLSAQDDIEGALENLKKLKETKPVVITGGFNAATVNYAANGIAARREPFAYALNANLNFNVYGKISIPFAVNYVNGEGSFQGNNAVKEFIEGIISRTGISPSYKGYTVHLGERALDFSKYTYTGVRWYGVGVEIRPKDSPVGVTAWRGRLSKRVFADTLGAVPTQPAYKRMGYGLKVDLGKQKHQVSFIAFGASDEYNPFDSISGAFGVKPQANFVVGINAKSAITKQIDVTLEYAASAFTDDLRSPERLVEDGYSYFNNIGSLFDPRTSTRYNNVINTSAKYKGRGYTIGATYLRVDPTFRSLGSVSIRNDVQAITANATTSLAKGRVNLGGNIGTERNNLENTLALNMNRLIWGANASWAVITPLIVSADYTNFNHQTEPSLINVNDSIRLVQVNQGQNYTAIYNTGSSLKHTIMANVAIQQVNDVQEFQGANVNDIESSNTVNNYMLNYSLNISAQQLTASLALLRTEIEGPGLSSVAMGPSLSLGKKFLDKKLDLKYSFTYLNNQQATQTLATTNNKIAAKYQLNKMNAFKIDLMLTNNNAGGDAGGPFSEFQGKFNYAFTF